MITVFLGILAISTAIGVGFSMWNNTRLLKSNLNQNKAWKEANTTHEEYEKKILELRKDCDETIKHLAFTINQISSNNAQMLTDFESLQNRVIACENKLFPKKEIKKEKENN